MLLLPAHNAVTICELVAEAKTLYDACYVGIAHLFSIVLNVITAAIVSDVYDYATKNTVSSTSNTPPKSTKKLLH